MLVLFRHKKRGRTEKLQSSIHTFLFFSVIEYVEFNTMPAPGETDAT